MIKIPETFAECLGLALREWRTTKWSTQDHAARAGGVSQSAWCRWETGLTTPDPTVLFGMGCDLTSLYRRAVDLALAHHVRLPWLQPRG